MPDIVEFLTARLDEDAAAAKAAGVGIRDRWHTIEWYDGRFEDGRAVSVDIHGIAGTPITSRGALLRVDGEHIARHDPARVLVEVKTKRRTLARHSDDGYGNCQGCGHEYADISLRYTIDECPELRDLAGPYNDHPDYKPAWRVQ